MNDYSQIIEAIKYLNFYYKNRFSKRFAQKEFFLEMLDIVACSLSEWTGATYVGVANNDSDKIYQEFFNAIYCLVEHLENNKMDLFPEEKDFIKSIKYNGNVYRILGYGNCNDKGRNKKIIPIFNDKYVSWSKNENNSYIESKLYGYRTKMYCKIEKPFFGLDLEKFQEYINKVSKFNYYISRGNEREVVFITKKEFIYDIKYYRM